MNSYILHIETATKVCSVSISKDGQKLITIESNDDKYAHGEKLNLFIIEALRKTSLNKEDLNAISISEGPGSYTGLRIGAATAKALCFGLNIPLITVGALESLYYLAKKKYSDTNLIPMLDARRMEVYATVYDKSGAIIKELSADVLDENSYAEFEPFMFFGDGAGKFVELWKSRNCTSDTGLISSAEGQIEPSFNKYLNKNFADVAYWEPFYLKDFIAGVKKKK